MSSGRGAGAGPLAARGLKGRRLAAVIAAILVGAVVVACGAQGARLSGNGGDAAGGGSAPGPALVDTDERGRTAMEQRGDGGQNAPDNPAQIAQRRIIKVGEISIEVDDVAAAIRAVRGLALELGGYVGGSSSMGDEAGATLQLRIPSDRFDDALERVRGLGSEVLSEVTREEDVTGALVDLEARIENLRASEASYRELLARATRIEDVLAVQSRLDEVRGQIEQMEAQRESLQGQADLATLTVSLVPVAVATTAEGWDLGRQVGLATAALLTVAQGLLTALIWIAIVLVPLAIGLGIVALIVVRLAGPFWRRVVERPPA